MPTYLCHGFRWKRDSIRFLILMNDIDDATPDWVVTPSDDQGEDHDDGKHRIEVVGN